MKRPLNILVVDDDIDNAQSLGELFEMEGHHSHVVHNGQAAVDAYLQSDFDLAFMDVMMPGLNGVESFLKIRQMRPHAHVFMMTGYSVVDLLKQAVSGGALGVLDKPVDAAALMELVREVGEDGVVVAQGTHSHYTKNLVGLAQSMGAKCRIVENSKTLASGQDGADLLILDMKVPLIDSVGHYKSLRAAGTKAHTIIVTSPSENQETDFDSWRDVAVTGILNKPFDPQELLLRLDTLIA